jgi:hypothetical protein
LQMATTTDSFGKRTRNCFYSACHLTLEKTSNAYSLGGSVPLFT